MSHRVLGDFSCATDLIRGDPPRLPSDIQTLLASHGWETAKGHQAREILHRMAHQLPEDDLPSFVRNTRIKMRRKFPHAELTVGYFEDSGVGKLRVRIRADNNAVIAELGKRTASQLLALPALRLDDMLLFESRDGQSLLQGGQLDPAPYRFWTRDNIAVSVPLLFSAMLIVVGAVVAWRCYDTGHPWRVLGDPIWAWYGRLFAPLLMAVVTTLSVVARDRRRQPGERTAEWDLTGTSDELRTVRRDGGP